MMLKLFVQTLIRFLGDSNKVVLSSICVLTSLFYYGYTLRRLISNENIFKIEIEDAFYGIIFFYITSIILNFITPIYYEISLFVVFWSFNVFL